MAIGYACLAIAVPGSNYKSCILKNASEKRLYQLIENNLAALEVMIDYNIENNIKLFRITSDLIPFGSSVAYDLPWAEDFSQLFSRISKKIKNSGMRVSLHPGQYTVLNSPKEDVAKRAALDLNYHARILDALDLDASHKMVLHLGGVYGDKESAKKRFLQRYDKLTDAVKKRLILENDGSLYHIEDILETAGSANIPVVYDNLHNETNPSSLNQTDAYWIKLAGETWKTKDGRQKIHYSQQNPEKSIGAHSESIHLPTFLNFYKKLPDPTIDIMLEVKDKNVSALKCINATTSDASIKELEKEWARYKYAVLEKSPKAYQEIRSLLKDKTSYPVDDFYQIIEAVYTQPLHLGHAANAVDHVWGYFKDKASDAEKRRYLKNLDSFTEDINKLPALKRQLLRLAEKYQVDYLLKGYYLYE